MSGTPPTGLREMPEPTTNAAPRDHAAQELRALLDAAVDAIVVIDAAGRIETFNPAAEKLFGFTEQEMVGRNVSLLMPEPDRSAHDDYLRRYLATGEAHIIGIGREVWARRRDGSTFPAALSVGRVASAETPRFVGFIHDLSERVAAENEVIQARDRLTHVARLSTMGEMAAGLAHEINQPLTAITTYAQACQYLLAQGAAVDAQEIRDALAQISQQALRAGEVIRRLRTFVSNREVRQERVDCNRLLEDLAALARPDARANDVQLGLDVEGSAAAIDGRSRAAAAGADQSDPQRDRCHGARRQSARREILVRVVRSQRGRVLGARLRTRASSPAR